LIETAFDSSSRPKKLMELGAVMAAGARTA
jgi:hypothetical protein